ncbi:MAG: DUF4920 domain-containing protein [Xanthomonadales bacterium]|jgi:hypothetical protein|nr:DUF4920 domain-containing protein [Xanthomonadales bacterium]
MNTKLLMVISMLATLAVQSGVADDPEVVRLSEPVAVTETHEIFGAPLPAAAEPIEIGELLADRAAYEDKDILLTARIAKVCQKKGCFFIVQHGADSVRVTFKDYGFFIPSDSGGKTVTLAGTFVRKPLSPEQAAHVARDLGEEPPANPPAFEYAIVATGVSIPRT